MGLVDQMLAETKANLEIIKPRILELKAENERLKAELSVANHWKERLGLELDALKQASDHKPLQAAGAEDQAIYDSIAKNYTAPQPQASVTLDGLTPFEYVGKELYEFQEATGCDTAEEYRSIKQASEPVAIVCGNMPGGVEWITPIDFEAAHGLPLYAAPQLQAQDAEDAKRYRELIYAVGNKYHGETRHDTALRYIKQSELGSDTAAKGETK